MRRYYLFMLIEPININGSTLFKLLLMKQDLAMWLSKNYVND